MLGALIFLGSRTEQPLDGKRLCSRFSLITVVADFLFEPFVASGKVIKDPLDKSSLLLPEAWVLGLFVFVGPCTEQPLDGERLCSRFSLVTVVADFLFEPFVASGKVIKDPLDKSSLLLPGAWVPGALKFLGPGTEQPLNGETLCSRFSLVTVIADSLFEPFVASAKVIKDSLDESSLLLPDAWVLGALLFVWSCTEQSLDADRLFAPFSLVKVFSESLFEPFVASKKVILVFIHEHSLLSPKASVLGLFVFVGPWAEKPLDGETLCSRFSLITVVADFLFEPFVASPKVIKDSLDESSLLLPDARVLGALLFVWSCTEQPQDADRLSSPFSLVKVFSESLFEPFVASKKLIRVLIPENSLLSPKAWVLGLFVFVGPCTEQPLDGERLCSCFSLVTVVADFLFEPFVASGKVIKDPLDKSSLLSPEAWVRGALLFAGPCTEQPLDGERLCSCFSLVTAVADSLFEPFVALGKVIKDSFDENSLLSLEAWVPGAL